MIERKEIIELEAETANWRLSWDSKHSSFVILWSARKSGVEMKVSIEEIAPLAKALMDMRQAIDEANAGS